MNCHGGVPAERRKPGNRAIFSVRVLVFIIFKAQFTVIRCNKVFSGVIEHVDEFGWVLFGALRPLCPSRDTLAVPRPAP
jgi:hypothetical protein